jgi:Asparaginase
MARGHELRTSFTVLLVNEINGFNRWLLITGLYPLAVIYFALSVSHLIACSIVCLSACFATVWLPLQQAEMEPVIIVHGGAWNIPDSIVAASKDGVRDATCKGYKLLMDGGTAVDAVHLAVMVMEDNSVFDAGTKWFN